MKHLTIAIVGGTGFVGSHLVARLARDRHTLRILTRRREAHRSLLVLPTAQIVQTDVYDVHQLTERFRGCDVVINLVGILNESRRKGGSFKDAHIQLTAAVLKACNAAGVPRYLHMSALNVGKGQSRYLISKAEAEDLAHYQASDDFHVTSFRPSVIFGPGDSFFNKFAMFLKLMPAVFFIACGNSRLQPVYVGDVAETIVRSLNDRDTWGKRFELCGPEAFSLKQLVQYAARVSGRKRWVIGLGPFLSRVQAVFLGLLPGKPMTLDNYRSLQVDSCCAHNGLEEFGITPTALDVVVPLYIGTRNRQTRLQDSRQENKG